MSTSRPRPTTKKNRWLLWAMLALLVILIVVAIYKGKNKEEGIEVEWEAAAARTIDETVSASGKIFPETEVKISSDVSGEIVELYVEEGDSVVQGQLLARIDPEAFASAVERGKASVNNAKAQMAMSEAGISTAQAQIEQIEAQLINARTIHQRNETLLKQGVIAQAEFDQSLSNLQGLEANLRSAKAGLESSKKSVEGAAFNVKVAEANLKELATSLNRTTIKAPTSGIVSSLLVEKGERVVGTIQMTGTEMMRIANLNTMEVQVEVSENDILKIALGDEVDIEVDAYLDKVFKGTVTEIANSANNISTAQATLNTDQVTNFLVKVRMDPASYSDLVKGTSLYPFRPGMSATVDIYTEKNENILTVPIQAVTVRDWDKMMDDKKDKDDSKEDEELSEVVFLKSGDTVSVVKVTTGIQDDKYISVLSGLSAGQEVITGPYTAVSKKLKPGEKIREKKSRKDKED